MDASNEPKVVLDGVRTVKLSLYEIKYDCILDELVSDRVLNPRLAT